MKKLYAQTLIGLSLQATLIKKAVHGVMAKIQNVPRPWEEGVNKFFQKYKKDHILPTREKSAWLAHQSGCIRCGLCDRYAEYDTQRPSLLASTHLRDLTQREYSRGYIAMIDGELSEDTAAWVCPAGVQLRKRVDLAKRTVQQDH